MPSQAACGGKPWPHEGLQPRNPLTSQHSDVCATGQHIPSCFLMSLGNMHGAGTWGQRWGEVWESRKITVWSPTSLCITRPRGRRKGRCRQHLHGRKAEPEGGQG